MILVWLIVIPFIGGLLCWQIERFGDKPTRWIALATMLAELLIALWLWTQLDFHLPALDGTATRWALEYQVDWIDRFGISFHLAIDGFVAGIDRANQLSRRVGGAVFVERNCTPDWFLPP